MQLPRCRRRVKGARPRTIKLTTEKCTIVSIVSIVSIVTDVARCRHDTLPTRAPRSTRRTATGGTWRPTIGCWGLWRPDGRSTTASQEVSLIKRALRRLRAAARGCAAHTAPHCLPTDASEWNEARFAIAFRRGSAQARRACGGVASRRSHCTTHDAAWLLAAGPPHWARTPTSRSSLACGGSSLGCSPERPRQRVPGPSMHYQPSLGHAACAKPEAGPDRGGVPKTLDFVTEFLCNDIFTRARRAGIGISPAAATSRHRGDITPRLLHLRPMNRR